MYQPTAEFYGGILRFFPPPPLFPQAVDISRAEYEPSQLDILFADGITPSNGLACTDFVFPPTAGSTSGFDGEEHHEALIR